MPILVGSIILAAVGWVASPLVAKLLKEAFASLGIDAEKKLQKLKVTILPVLKLAIEEAEGSTHYSLVEEWVKRLKDAYDGVQGALDLNNRRLKGKTAATESCSKRRTNRVRSPFHVQKHLKWIPPVLKGCRDMLSLQKIKLKRKLNRFEKIANEGPKLLELLRAKPGKTVASDGEEDSGQIIPRLTMEPAAIRNPRSSRIPRIVIVSCPTLAQYIFKQLGSGLDDGYFDHIMCVDASRNFHASEIMKRIIQQAFITGEPQDPLNSDDLPGMVHSYLRNLDTMVVTNLDSPEVLQLKMNKKPNAKKFLHGEDHRNNWDTPFRCLRKCCLPGSKILITSIANDAHCLEGEIERAPTDLVVPTAAAAAIDYEALAEELSAERDKLMADIVRLTATAAAAEVKEREIAKLERRVRALKEAKEEAAKASAERDEDLRKLNLLLVGKMQDQDDALMKLRERNSSLEEEIIKLKDALVVFEERNAVLEGEIGEKKNDAEAPAPATAVALGAVALGAASVGAAAAAAVTAVYLHRRS